MRSEPPADTTGEGPVGGRFEAGRYTASFLVKEDPATLFRRLTPEHETEPTDVPAWLRVFPSIGQGPAARVVAVEAPKRIAAEKCAEPCRNSLIELSLEPDASTATDASAAHASHTCVTLEQSSFPSYMASVPDLLVAGGDQISADLALFLRTGVLTSRHSLPWAFPGFTAREVATGLEVRAVLPEGWAARIGLAPGDLLLTLNDAPLFSQAGLQTLLRVFPQGQEASASWVRSRTLHSASAQL